MSRARLTAKFRERWNDEAIAANRARVLYTVTMRVLARWALAGFPSATLVDGLPRPERGHVADWQGEGRFRKCGTCGRSNAKQPEPTTCGGPSGYDLVWSALDAGIPFGVGPDGLPTAGVPVDHDEARGKLARATCQPARKAAA